MGRMLQQRRRRYASGSFCVILVGLCLLSDAAFGQQPSAAKAVGTVKSVSGNSVVLQSDNGSETTVTFSDSARIVRAAPGQTDLKSAPAIQVSDIQVGDRISAHGQAGDANAVIATFAMVMKQGDIAQRQQAERDEWRRGIGGIVKEVNSGTGTITIANALAAGGKPIAIHVAPNTNIRRYSPDSVKFDDAKPGTLDQIKPGDQLRARGAKNADGTEFTAQAIVSGTFRDVAGTVVSTDAASSTVTIMDLATKKPIAVKVSADSQLRKLPQMVAMRFAMRMKGGDAGAQAASGGPQGSSAEGGNSAQGSHVRSGQGGPANSADSGNAGQPHTNWRRGSGDAPDVQQMISRMPALSISELNKGDAVMLVATEGSSNSQPTAITLLAGVEPILSAAPAGTSAATILSPWNLGEPGGAGGEAAQ